MESQPSALRLDLIQKSADLRRRLSRCVSIVNFKNLDKIEIGDNDRHAPTPE